MTSVVVSSASSAYAVSTNVTVTSSVPTSPPFVPVDERNVEVSVQITNEDFHCDLENKSSTKYQELLAKVNKTVCLHIYIVVNSIITVLDFDVIGSNPSMTTALICNCFGRCQHQNHHASKEPTCLPLLAVGLSESN